MLFKFDAPESARLADSEKPEAEAAFNSFNFSGIVDAVVVVDVDVDVENTSWLAARRVSQERAAKRERETALTNLILWSLVSDESNESSSCCCGSSYGAFRQRASFSLSLARANL